MPDELPIRLLPGTGLLLARDLAAAAESAIGTVLKVHREAYAAAVPALERVHPLAKLAALNAARDHLAREFGDGAPGDDKSDGTNKSKLI